MSELQYLKLFYKINLENDFKLTLEEIHDKIEEVMANDVPYPYNCYDNRIRKEK